MSSKAGSRQQRRTASTIININDRLEKIFIKNLLQVDDDDDYMCKHVSWMMEYVRLGIVRDNQPTNQTTSLCAPTSSIVVVQVTRIMPLFLSTFHNTNSKEVIQEFMIRSESGDA